VTPAGAFSFSNRMLLHLLSRSSARDLWCVATTARAGWVGYSDANRNGRDFGWEIAHTAVSRCPPIPLYTIVVRTGAYTYGAEVWDLSIIQGHFLSPRAKP
jgi:hypothetical protein